LSAFTREGEVPPEVNMLVLAGVFLVVGAACVGLVREGRK
jgi:maltose/moltooligosaccharide transporter